MKLSLRFFGHLSEAISADAVDLEVAAGADVAAVRCLVAGRHPDLAARLERCMVAVNAEFAAADLRLEEGDEVAFLPPVSGG